ncbi:MAG: hypothetical protein AAF657_28735 [Acidobacteriota bacterium]
MTQYFFKLKMIDDGTPKIAMGRVYLKQGIGWREAPPVLGPPGEPPKYKFNLEDQIGFFLNNNLGQEIEIQSAQVEFKVKRNGSARNPFRDGSDENIFTFGQELSDTSDFIDPDAAQSWFLPGRYGSGIPANAAPLAQNGTYSKTITIVAAPASDPNNPFPPFVDDPTWVVGDGNPVGP